MSRLFRLLAVPARGEVPEQTVSVAARASGEDRGYLVRSRLFSSSIHTTVAKTKTLRHPRSGVGVGSVICRAILVPGPPACRVRIAVRPRDVVCVPRGRRTRVHRPSRDRRGHRFEHEPRETDDRSSALAITSKRARRAARRCWWGDIGRRRRTLHRIAGDTDKVRPRSERPGSAHAESARAGWGLARAASIPLSECDIEPQSTLGFCRVLAAGRRSRWSRRRPDPHAQDRLSPVDRRCTSSPLTRYETSAAGREPAPLGLTFASRRTSIAYRVAGCRGR